MSSITALHTKQSQQKAEATAAQTSLNGDGSIGKRKFKMIQRVLSDESLSSPIDKLVMLVLAYHYNPDYGCFPSAPTIAREASLKKRCVYDVIKRLEADDKLSKVSKLGQVNRYTLYPQPDEQERVQKEQPLVADAAGAPVHSTAPTRASDSTLIVSKGNRNAMKVNFTTDSCADSGSADAPASARETEQRIPHGSSAEAEKWIVVHQADVQAFEREFANRGFNVLESVRKCLNHSSNLGKVLSVERLRGWLKREDPAKAKRSAKSKAKAVAPSVNQDAVSGCFEDCGLTELRNIRTRYEEDGLSEDDPYFAELNAEIESREMDLRSREEQRKADAAKAQAEREALNAEQERKAQAKLEKAKEIAVSLRRMPPRYDESAAREWIRGELCCNALDAEFYYGVARDCGHIAYDGSGPYGADLNSDEVKALRAQVNAEAQAKLEALGLA